MRHAVLTNVIVFSGLFGCVTSSQELPSHQTPAARELIVKFVPETDGGFKVARAAAQGDKPTDEVSAFVAALGTEVGVPLEAKRLGSGGTVVVEIRSLSEALAARLKRQSFVKSAQAMPATPNADAAVQVEFVSGSQEASTVSQGGGLEQRGSIDALIAKLEGMVAMPLSGRVPQAGQLILKPELQKTTAQLVEWIRKRADVEYAQPNYATYSPMK